MPSSYEKFKISYNSHKNIWSISELMTKCVQEEDRQRAKSKDMNTVNTATHGSGPSSSKKFKSHWGKKLGMKGNTKMSNAFSARKLGILRKTV